MSLDENSIKICGCRKRLTITEVQDAAYFRVSAKGSGANLIVTLDEEIT